MKRKDKIYALIGRAVTGLSMYILVEVAFYNLAILILDNCCIAG